MDLSRVTLVLDKVHHPDNLGSALRAMKNSGLGRITLSDPQTFEFERARKMATDADDLLEHLRVEKDLHAAVAHGTLVAGTTSRTLSDRPSLWLGELVQRASAETDAGGEVVIVFGCESRGLSDAELDECQLVVNIPTAPAKPSINLAQSVMLVSHQLFLASLGQAPASTPASPPAPREPLARVQTIQALKTRMREVLLAADYLNPQNPEAILTELERMLERAEPTQREAELWLNAFKHLGRAMKADALGDPMGLRPTTEK